MIKKCSRCGAFKEITANFRYLEARGKYYPYCRTCEARIAREQRKKQRKKKFMRMFMDITQDYSVAEMDYMLRDMEKLWRAKHE